MSFFLLAKAARFDTAASALQPLVERHGFSLAPPLTVGDWRLQLIDNPHRSALTRIEIGEGTTLIALGHFVYNGAQGEAALRAFHREFDPAAPDWAKTQGHFTLLLIEPERVVALCDGLGAHKIYCDREQTVFSNSFLAALAALPAPRIDPLGAYEYAWCGAFFGTRSFVDGLSCLPANSILRAGSAVSVTQHPAPTTPAPIDADTDFETCVIRNLEALRETVSSTVAGWNARLRLSFSGGYDSRLLLGLLMEQGIRPELYVYGPENDRDVRIARILAEGEGLVWRRVDKGQRELPPPEGFPELLEEALVYFDGWKNTGLFDNGADIPDRHSRHEGGYLPLNGGLGEIYRNFFNLRDRSYPAEAVVDAFYRNFRREWASRGFDGKTYRGDMAAAMRAQLDGVQGKRLSSQQAQMLYPLFRGRFWTAREAEINQRFGPMAFPYLEHRCIREAGSVPLRYKALGRLQAAMICRVAPRLAAYPTDYGFSFDERPGLRYRFDETLSALRPIFLRPQLGALKKRRHEARPRELTEPYLAAVLDTEFPYTRPLFAHTHIGDADTFNRVATLEYLAQRFGFQETLAP